MKVSLSSLQLAFGLVCGVVTSLSPGLCHAAEDTIELGLVNDAGQPLRETPELQVGDSTLLKAVALPSPLESGAEFEVKKPTDLQMRDAAKESSETEDGTAPQATGAEGLPPFVSDVLPKSGQLFLQVEWLRAGDWSLEGYELWQTTPEKKKLGVFAAPHIAIKSSINKDDEKPTEPFPMLGPVSLGLPSWLILTLVGLAAGTLIVLLSLLIRWNRNQKATAVTQPVRPPAPIDERVLSWLQDLERQALWEKGDLKRHYFRLSEIAKTYLGERYSIDALESTTRELMEMLERGKLLEDTKLDGIEKLFSEMDIVKFTNLKPAEDAPKRHLEAVRKLVLATRIVSVSAVQTVAPSAGQVPGGKSA